MVIHGSRISVEFLITLMCSPVYSQNGFAICLICLLPFYKLDEVLLHFLFSNIFSLIFFYLFSIKYAILLNIVGCTGWFCHGEL